MGDRHDIAVEARADLLQAEVFELLCGYGLAPEQADATARRVPVAPTFDEQMYRVSLGSEIVAQLRATIGLGEDERPWVYGAVNAACHRHEQQQRQQRQVPCRRGAAVASNPVAVACGSTAIATAVMVGRSEPVVFRRRQSGVTNAQ